MGFIQELAICVPLKLSDIGKSSEKTVQNLDLEIDKSRGDTKDAPNNVEWEVLPHEEVVGLASALDVKPN